MDGTVPVADVGITGTGRLRLFGRGLAWANGSCVPAWNRQPSATTVLRVASQNLVAISATCYEATFSLATLAPGTYANAVLSTPWGTAAAPFVVAPVPTPPPTTAINVDQVRSRHRSAAASVPTVALAD
jgi:hypothetical protein